MQPVESEAGRGTPRRPGKDLRARYGSSRTGASTPGPASHATPLVLGVTRMCEQPPRLTPHAPLHLPTDTVHEPPHPPTLTTQCPVHEPTFTKQCALADGTTTRSPIVATHAARSTTNVFIDDTPGEQRSPLAYPRQV